MSHVLSPDASNNNPCLSCIAKRLKRRHLAPTYRSTVNERTTVNERKIPLSACLECLSGRWSCSSRQTYIDLPHTCDSEEDEVDEVEGV